MASIGSFGKPIVRAKTFVEPPGKADAKDAVLQVEGHGPEAPRVHRNAQVAERFEHRQDARELLVLRHRRGARPRRLAADVDEVRALHGERARMRDRRGGREVAATVGKRIGRDVHHAHDERLIEPE